MKHAGKLKSIEQAMDSRSHSLAVIQRERGVKFTEAYVKLWLIYINDILSLKRPMKESQIELCASMILSDYRAFKISDLTYLSKRIVSGDYGELYESLTIPKILIFFSDYYSERCEVAEEQSLRAHQDFKSESTFNYSSNIERILSGSKGFNSKE